VDEQRQIPPATRLTLGRTSPVNEDMMDQQIPGSGATTRSISVTVPFVSGEVKPLEILGDFVFDPADPYAVHLVIGRGEEAAVTWTFARELLAEGCYDPCGNGDVVVWPCLGTHGEAVVIIELRSPSGMAMLQTPSRAVQGFLAETYDLVPAGSESQQINLDHLVTHLLAV
jgi:hypothetical protein